MHFDQREQRALRAAGLTTETLQSVSAAVAEDTEREAARLAAFFDRETVYSDLDLAHSTGDVHDHTVAFVDLFTHADEIRGYLRFDSWGAWIAGGRVLRPAATGQPDGEAGETASSADTATVVELTLGPTVHDRVRFALDPEEL